MPLPHQVSLHRISTFWTDAFPTHEPPALVDSSVVCSTICGRADESSTGLALSVMCPLSRLCSDLCSDRMPCDHPGRTVQQYGMPGMASPRVSFNAENHLQVKGFLATRSSSTMKRSCMPFASRAYLWGSSVPSSCISTRGNSRPYACASRRPLLLTRACLPLSVHAHARVLC